MGPQGFPAFSAKRKEINRWQVRDIQMCRVVGCGFDVSWVCAG
jgi:hypothetical protein